MPHRSHNFGITDNNTTEERPTAAADWSSPFLRVLYPVLIELTPGLLRAPDALFPGPGTPASTEQGTTPA